MPKLPQYDSQVAMAQGSVQPGSLYGPNIHQETGLAAMFNQINKEANRFVNTTIRTEKEAQNERRIIEQLNASNEGYRKQAEIDAKYVNYNNPDLPDRIKEDLTKAHDEIIQTVSPEFQSRIGPALSVQFAHTYGSAIKAHALRVAQQNEAEIMAGAGQLADTSATAFVAGDTSKYAMVMGQLAAMADQMQGKIPGVAKSAGGVKQWAEIEVGKRITGLLLESDPQRVLELVKTTEGMRLLGVPLEKKDNIVKEAEASLFRKQAKLYDEVLKGFVGNQPPSPEVVAQLSGGQQMAVKNLLESMGQEDKQASLLVHGNKVLQLSRITDPDKASAEADHVYNGILTEPGLNAKTKLQLMGQCTTFMTKTATAESKFPHNIISEFKRNMTHRQGILFGIDVLTGAKGLSSLPPNTPLEDKVKHIYRMSINYMSESRNEELDKAKEGRYLIQRPLEKKGVIDKIIDHLYKPKEASKTKYELPDHVTGKLIPVTKEQYDRVKKIEEKLNGKK